MIRLPSTSQVDVMGGLRMIVCLKCNYRNPDGAEWCANPAGCPNGFLPWHGKQIEGEAPGAAGTAVSPPSAPSPMVSSPGQPGQAPGASLSQTQLRVAPGAEVNNEIRVRNRSRVVEQFTFTVNGIASQWASIQPPVLSLFPDTAGVVRLVIRPPKSPEARAGTSPFTVLVTSTRDAAIQTSEEGRLTIEPFSVVNASLTPRTTEGYRKGRFELRLENQGNTPIKLDIVATRPDERLAFNAQPEAVSLEPGQSSSSALSVRSRHWWVKGFPRTFPFEVAAISKQTGSQPTNGVLMQKALMPSWLPTAVALVLAAAVGLALLRTNIAGRIASTVLPPLAGSPHSTANLGGKIAGAIGSPAASGAGAPSTGGGSGNGPSATASGHPTSTAVPSPYRDQNWQSFLANGTVYGVSCASAICVAVGDYGIALVSTDGGQNWTHHQMPDTASRVACSSASTCVAVGGAGRIYTTSDGGSTWAAPTSGVTDAIFGVACPSTTNCYAVGAQGLVLTTTNQGVTWSPQPRITSGNLNGVSCGSVNVCTAVSDRAEVFTTTNAGQSWSREQLATSTSRPPPPFAFFDLSCPGSLCQAAAVNGMVWGQVSSSSLSQEKTGISSTLLGIACLSKVNCIAVGASGTIIASFDHGYSWVAEPSQTTNDLQAISCSGAATCVAAGKIHTVLRTSDAGKTWTAGTLHP